VPETLSHRWYAGTFTLRAQAADLSGALSDWSAPRQLRIAAGERFPDSVVAAVPLPSWCWDIAVTQCGDRLYLACDDGLYLMRVADLSLTDSLSMLLDAESGIELSPDGDRLYVVSTPDRCVYVVRTADLLCIDTIPLAGHPIGTGAAISSSAGSLYVPDLLADVIRVIDLATGALVADVAVSLDPTRVAVAPAGDCALVGHECSAWVETIDTRSHAVLGRTWVGDMTQTIIFSSDGRRAFVSVEVLPGLEEERAGFAVLQAPDYAVTDVIPSWGAESYFFGGVRSPGGAYGYCVPDDIEHRIVVLDLARSTMLGGVSAAGRDFYLGVMACLPDGRLAVCDGGNRLVVFGFSAPRLGAPRAREDGCTD
jgi:DNA-binding beta-propeller fold protein YncE